MFFAPPKVHSLSRYSEFGVNLHHRHFMIMLCIALFIHAAVIAVYSLMPTEAVMRVPVRVLNIKLNGGPGMDAPTRAMMPAVQNDVEAEKPAPQKPHHDNADARDVNAFVKEHTAQSAVDSEIAQEAPKPARAAADANPKAPRMPAAVKPAHAAAKKADEVIPAPDMVDLSLATPKKYVREDVAPPTSAKKTPEGSGGNGSGVSGTAAGDEIVQRYEQLVSLWIENHKSYPEAAKRARIEGDAVVRIRINRDGRILYSAIDRSSGNSVLDAAALDMVKASNPVPVVPGDYPQGSKLEFLIPVNFSLQ